MGFQISDCRFVRPGSRTGCLSSAEGDDEPLTSGAKALWILERLRGPKGPLFHGAGTCRTVLDVSHGAAHGAGRVARCWTTGEPRTLSGGTYGTAEAVPFHNCANPRVSPQPVKPCFPRKTFMKSCVPAASALVVYSYAKAKGYCEADCICSAIFPTAETS